jgi:CrcB protein
MSPTTWLAFLLAAAVGAPARYLLDGVVQERTGGVEPWGTLVVNVVGSFTLGLLTGAGLYHGLAAPARTALGTGFCGAFTTFSTFTFETVRLAEEGANRAAVVNVAVSLVLGLAAAAAGLALAWLV